MLKKIEINRKVIAISIWLSISSAVFLSSALDHSTLMNSIGTTSSILFLILIPGSVLGITILKFKEFYTALVFGSSILIAVIIPIHALFSTFNFSWILILMLLLIDLYLLFNYRRIISQVTFQVQYNVQFLSITILIGISLILLFRQSLYVPANNLDQYLVWPDTYNAIAQAGEITHHGPRIFPFVADAQVPLKYHWGAFSLGSFISIFGTFDLVVSIFKTQFVLIGILYLGLLFLVGKTLGKSWIAGVFSLILGGFTIYPTFPELNEQIGLARPFISSTSMPQFTANLFAILSVYLIYNFRNLKFNYYFKTFIIFFVTLAATLSKGPVGLLIVILVITYLLFNLKLINVYDKITLSIPSILGFLVGYFFVSSSNPNQGRSGTTLWFNPTDTLNLLAEGYGISLNLISLMVFALLFIFSFASLIIVNFISYKNKTINYSFPLLVTIFAGIGGTLLLETWGDSQLFLLYSVIPFIAILLAFGAFYKEQKLSINTLSILILGLMGQPLLFSLFSSFVPRAQVIKTFGFWILSTSVIYLIAIFYSKISKQSISYNLLIVSISIGMFSGLTKFDQKAFSLPEHPYSISLGTYEIANYLKKISNRNDLVATNRHCAGPNETQTCTARQFAISAISERRVFLEGWSYTTCPLTEPILNKYWKEQTWKDNQNFFIQPSNENFEYLRISGVDWLVVDSTRPSISSYEPFAELIKSEGSVSLWKVKNPYSNKTFKQNDPCGPKSEVVTK